MTNINDLVFITNENNQILSGGFEITSDSFQNGGCIIPYGLLYNDKHKEPMNIYDDMNSIIEDDLYDKLLSLAMYPKNKTRQNKKQSKLRKTKRKRKE
jgi:hypothetical protein